MIKFNPGQLLAINHHTQPAAVIAGAGSGKSTVLIERIRNLIETHFVSEQDILAISFTSNTADELKKKLKKMGYVDVNIGTFHAVCGRLLAKENIFVTFDKMIKEWQIEKLFVGSGNEKIDTKDIIGFISYQKNYLRTYTDEFMVKESNYSEIELRRYFKLYEEFKNKNGLHDFDDYMIMCLDMLKKNPNKYTYEFVLVDEHQDSNLVQNLLLKELCKSNNMFCVFDYRQALYTFRGSNPEYCMNFADEWKDSTVINLDINYRSARNIVDKANGFIKRYYGDYEHYSDAIAHNQKDGSIKIYTSANREQEGIRVANQIEKLIAEQGNPKEIAVLYRLNAHSVFVENELKKKDIEYDITNDGSFFKRKEIAGILAYMKLIINPHDDGAFLEMFKLRNQPLAYFPEKLLTEMKKFSGVNDMSMYETLINMKYSDYRQAKSAEQFEGYINRLRLQKDKNISAEHLVENIIKVFQMEEYIVDKYKNKEDREERLESLEVLKTFVKSNSPEKFIAYVSNTKRKNKENCVKLMSIHASKGLEFDNIFVVGVEDKKFPHEKSDLIDEARLFYVGVTRARENLVVSEIGERNRFVEEYIK
ncbi:ATP-dependent helicase [Paenibacillus donghaensis]|uniref:DNA 3'-5' helicase n=1 Tax=Paenibacillus donghaensis TaxID=414771 RepID=A0A2Z2KFH1_9BACL|nr:ATP-dependent helicase [Paenibacillus donghaensis]ASA22735.1 DNA helicase UvrD [Paenibacillus donghaensis]